MLSHNTNKENQAHYIKISQKYNINLENYKWNPEFLTSIFSIELNKDLETNASTLGEIYKLGFNIGHCGLTSRYIAIKYPQAILHYGIASLLIGTNSSPRGEHAWITIENFLIDPTLMICIPLDISQSLGYISKKEIAPESARILSEYDIYDNEFNNQQKNKIYIK